MAGLRAGGHVASGVAFLGTGGLVLLYALRGSGSYDLVVFQENGLVIWWVVALGIALGLLPRSRPSRGALWLLAALLAYVVWTALSLTWTDSAERTSEEIARSLDYLGLVAALLLAVDRETWRSAAAGLGVGAVIVCVVAVGSRLAPSVLGHDQVDAAFGIHRLSVPFGYWNAVAAWGAICATFALAWSAHDTSRFRRAVALMSVPVASLTTYLSYSRAGVGGIALGLVLVVALSRNRFTALAHALTAAAATAATILVIRHSPQIAQGTGTDGALRVLVVLLCGCAFCALQASLTLRFGLDRRRLPRAAVRRLGVTAAIVVLVAAGGYGPGLASRAWRSFRSPPVTTTSSDPTSRLGTLAGTRYPVWRSAVHAFSAHPLIGTGAGTFEFWWNEHATDGEALQDAHNLWLQNMAELGLPGLLLIVAVALTALRSGLAVLRRADDVAARGCALACVAAFAVYLVHASVDWMWESTAVTVLGFGAIAIVTAQRGQPGRRPGAPVRAVVVLVAVAAGVLQLPGILSATDLRRSQSAEQAGQLGAALGWANDAISAEPWSASAHEQRGLVLESDDEFTRAVPEFRAAVSDEPQNYERWLLLARIDTELGQLGRAVRAYDRARRLAPRAAVFN